MERLSLHVQNSLRGNAPLIATPVLQTKYRSPNTTEAVLRALLNMDLRYCNVTEVARSMGISSSTLRRRLQDDQTSFSFLSDRARQYRCEQLLKTQWLPGKCLADELGYAEPNSFYRAFKRWTGMAFREYKRRLH
jgi:AraC-like DNA-binding protein